MSDYSTPRTRLLFIALGLALPLLAPPLYGQEPEAPATLTLDQAIALARQRNPDFRITSNDERNADWNLRQSYAAFLPTARASSYAQYVAPGTPNFGGVLTAQDIGISRTPPYYSSGYNISLGLQLSGATFFRIAQQRAAHTATEARIDAAAFTLASDVTRQYLAALRAQDNAALARSQLQTAQENLKLSQARVDVGAATRLDVTQSEVAEGRAEVALLQAENDRQTQTLQLLQQIGVQTDHDIQLTSTFQVFEPTWTVNDLVSQALQSHPQMESARAAEAANRAAARAAKTSYLPTLSLSGSWSGFARQVGDDNYLLKQARNSAENSVSNCEYTNAIIAGLTTPLPGYPKDCSQYAYTDQLGQQVLAANRVFPFNFTTSPPTFAVQVSLPIFDGFSREQQVEAASVAADNAREQRRATELNIRTQVATSLLALKTSYKSVAIEERNVAAAKEQLELAQERYRLGAGSIIELTQAQENRVQADQAHLAALYSFHENLAALEAAVGRTLR